VAIRLSELTNRRRPANALKIVQAGVAPRRLTYVLAVVLAFAGGTAAARTVEHFEVGSWQGVAETSDPAGKLSHCAAFQDFPNGVRLIFTSLSDGRWRLGLEKPDWALTEGSDYPIRFRVDRRAFADARMRAVRPTQLFAPIGAQLLGQIARGNNLAMVVEGGEFAFPLTGSRRALAAVEECVARNRDRVFPPPAGEASSPPADANAAASATASRWQLPLLADNAIETFDAGDWHGAAYGGWAGDVTHCAIRRDAPEGTSLSFALLNGGDFMMALARNDFALVPGMRSSVAYRFAGEIVTGQGGAASRSVYVTPLRPGPIADAEARLRGAADLGVNVEGRELTLPLDGIGNALDALDACAERHGLTSAAAAAE
jgi:hypothetical protein